MQLSSKAAEAIAERARQIFQDLKELAKDYPEDARQIAAQILATTRSQFGNAADLLTI